jgi:hypothetical protein
VTDQTTGEGFESTLGEVRRYRSVAMRTDRHEGQPKDAETDSERDKRSSRHVEDGGHEATDPDRDREQGQSGAPPTIGHGRERRESVRSADV